MLPNINICENGWSNLYENFRIVAPKLLTSPNSHHQINQFTFCMVCGVCCDIDIFKLTTHACPLIEKSVELFKISFSQNIEYNLMYFLECEAMFDWLLNVCHPGKFACYFITKLNAIYSDPSTFNRWIFGVGYVNWVLHPLF